MCMLYSLNIGPVDVSAAVEKMKMLAVAEFESSLSSPEVLQVMHRDNVPHMLLVDNVNAKHMDNADMQLP